MRTTDVRAAAGPADWDAIADGYDRYVLPAQAPLAEQALARAGVRAGERLLDVAAGPGGLSLAAARLGARVLATDFSPAMVDRFVAHARAEALDARARVMDAHALDIEDDSFDVTASQFGVTLVADRSRALAEMMRVTRPGGRVLVVAYGPPRATDVLQYFVGALRTVVPGLAWPADEPPGVSDAWALRRALEDAGLVDVRVDGEAERLTFASGEAVWRWFVHSSPLARRLAADLDDDRRAMVREVLDGMVRDACGDGTSVMLTNAVHIATGRK